MWSLKIIPPSHCSGAIKSPPGYPEWARALFGLQGPDNNGFYSGNYGPIIPETGLHTGDCWAALGKSQFFPPSPTPASFSQPTSIPPTPSFISAVICQSQNPSGRKSPLRSSSPTFTHQTTSKSASLLFFWAQNVDSVCSGFSTSCPNLLQTSKQKPLSKISVKTPCRGKKEEIPFGSSKKGHLNALQQWLIYNFHSKII